MCLFLAVGIEPGGVEATDIDRDESTCKCTVKFLTLMRVSAQYKLFLVMNKRSCLVARTIAPKTRSFKEFIAMWLQNIMM